MALEVIQTRGSAHRPRDGVVELIGTRTEVRRARSALEDSPVVLALQLMAIDNFVEIIRLRTELAEKDRRIAILTVGLGTWRERAGAQREARRRDAAEAYEREHEIVTLLHQQMQVADSATAELERCQARAWWRRRGA